MGEYIKNLHRVEKYAKENNLILNPDKARVDKVVTLMTENYKATNEYICPCKQTTKPPVAGVDTLCPCPEIMNEIKEKGHCFCQLFFAPPLE
jgi:ferredoxin-thioredoxin reductase catalytic subunit